MTTRRAHLDGLRAVAVYLVVAFHAGLGRFAGGFIGVDVFFVLSGYLVTQVLLRDLDGHGHVRFGRFYARRARRLLPASLLVITLTAIAYPAIATPAQVQEATAAFRSAYLYVANWHFIARSTDYFATDATRSPVLHLWSLAVEEQFYLVWPLLLAGLVRVTSSLDGRATVARRALVAGGALASLAWALSLRGAQPERAYLGTDARAYQLLAGASLALAPLVVTRVGRVRGLPAALAGSGLVGIILLATTFGALDPIERGIGATVATLAVLAGMDAAGRNPIAALLSRPAPVYLGRISYGTYLWHWPLVLALEEWFDLSHRSLAVVVALVATGLASASYQLLEMPVREARRLDTLAWPVVAAGLTLSVVAALVVVPRLDATASGSATAAPVVAAGPAGGNGFTPVPAGFDDAAITAEGFGTTVDCVGTAPDGCTVVRGTGPSILLMGDSNAQMWIPAFTEMARSEDLTLSLAVTPACAWQRGVLKPFAYGSMADCERNKDDAYRRVIPALDPDLIVLVNKREPHGAPQRTFVDDEYNRALRDATPSSLRALARPGRELVIIGAAPLPRDLDFNPLTCLAKATAVEACRFVADGTTTWLDRLQADAASRQDHVTIADFDRLICPFLPICDPIIGGRVVFWNQEHITARYSRSLAPAVSRYLHDQGLLPA